MGGGGKGQDTGDTHQTNSLLQVQPWGPVQDELADLFDTAQHTGAQQPYPYPGVVPYSPTSVAGMEAITNRALQGNPLLGMAQGTAAQTMGGQYLDASRNPLFNRAFQASYRDIVPQVDASAMMSGRYGGGLSQMNKIQALGDAWSDQWMNNFGAERDRMLRTQAMTPALTQADYYDMDRLLQVGGMQENKAQQALTDAANRWYFQQQAPFDLQSHQAGIYQTSSPYSVQQGTNTQPIYGNQMSPLGGALGGAATGAFLGGPMGITGMGLSPVGGAAIGAGMGLMSAMK